MGGASDHEVGIDGLIKGSEALKGEVKREDIEDLRVNALEEEKKRMGNSSAGDSGARSRASSSGLEVQVPMPMQD